MKKIVQIITNKIKDHHKIIVEVILLSKTFLFAFSLLIFAVSSLLLIFFKAYDVFIENMIVFAYVFYIAALAIEMLDYILFPGQWGKKQLGAMTMVSGEVNQHIPAKKNQKILLYCVVLFIMICITIFGVIKTAQNKMAYRESLYKAVEPDTVLITIKDCSYPKQYFKKIKKEVRKKNKRINFLVPMQEYNCFSRTHIFYAVGLEKQAEQLKQIIIAMTGNETIHVQQDELLANNKIELIIGNAPKN